LVREERSRPGQVGLALLVVVVVIVVVVVASSSNFSSVFKEWRSKRTVLYITYQKAAVIIVAVPLALIFRT
jgi:type II secretory pathway component PulK